MKKLQVMAMFMLFAMLSACGYMTDKANLTWEAQEVLEMQSDLEKSYFEVVAIISEVQEQSKITDDGPVFNEFEMTILNRVNEDVADVLEYMQGITDADGVLESSDDLLLMVNIIEDTYKDAKYVVESHESAFTERQRITMGVFDEKASDDWDKITELLEDPTQANMEKVLFIANDMVGTSLSMLKYLGLFI